MSFELKKLPYAIDALEPHMSKETLQYHHGKHLFTYVSNLNKLIEGTEFENMKLEDIILRSDGAIFNNAAQVFNHNFFFEALSPNPSKPTPRMMGRFMGEIDRTFGSFDEFIKKFSDMAISNFGSGWTWLVINKNHKLDIINTSNAQNPLTQGFIPLLTCDVWEHAYYIDTRNSRPQYLENFFKLVDWDVVEGRIGGG